MSKIFVDTNVLVYAADISDRKKRLKARAALEELERDGNGVISTQVMQEFYVTATRKLAIEPLKAKAILHSFRYFETIQVTPDLVMEAIDCSVIQQLSFWDALIIVSGESARCEFLWSEDLQSGQIVRGLKIVNPFAAE